MVQISAVNRKLICDVASKLINIGINFEYQVKDNCIFIGGVTKHSVLYLLSPLEIKDEDVLEK